MPDIRSVQSDLAAWLVRQHDHVRVIGSSIIGLLGSAQIGTRPHPMIVAHLAEDVKKLEHALAHVTSGLDR